MAESLIAICGLVAVAPALVVSGALIKLTSSGPVLFRQARAGRHGRSFTMYKFRTMRASHRGPAFTAGDDARVTLVGRVLRTTKLDELPTLWNVVRGELSLVGPRPEVEKYVDRSDPLWRAVLEAKPGLTSPMAIELRNEEELLASVEGDRERYYRETLLPYKLLGHRDYLAQRTWQTDLGVLAKTALSVAFGAREAPPSRETIERRVREHLAKENHGQEQERPRPRSPRG